MVRRLVALLVLLGFATVSVACSPDAREERTTTKESRSPADEDEEDVEIELENIAGGLDSPVGIAAPADGSDRLFVLEQGGTIRVVADGEVAPDPFLDITDLTAASGEQGLLGLAFHPDYADNGRFFVNYTDLEGDTVIAEYARESADKAEPGAAQVILQIDQPFSNHNGGHLAFGPDGLLYIGMGDGGGAGDPQDRAQDLSSFLGKMLRIDLDGAQPYESPEDNPFIADEGARPEIWAYGLRNPWRYSFDRSTDDLWIGDVGQDFLEEIDRAPGDEAGIDYGWSVLEGTECFDLSDDCPRKGRHAPLAVYDHEDGCSVTGGYVYRGSDYPELDGLYFFGDFCSGTIWSVDAAGPDSQEPTEMMTTDLSISSFGEDEAGELYMTDISGGLWRVVGG